MSRQVPTPNPKMALLTPDLMKHGINRLEKLIDKIRAFDVSIIQKRLGPEVKALQADIGGTLSSVFGDNTIPYNRYKDAAILEKFILPTRRQPYGARGGGYAHDDARQAQQSVNEGKSRSIQLLQSAVDWLREELEALKLNPPSPGPKLKLNEHMGAHPQVAAKCEELYASGAFAEAVEKSFKIVRDRLRVLTNFEKGSEAFGKGKLHIRGAAAPNVDADFNEGAKFLMMAIDMFRNEKSHTSDAKITSPARAQHYLMLSSLAMYLLDDAEIRQ